MAGGPFAGGGWSPGELWGHPSDMRAASPLRLMDSRRPPPKPTCGDGPHSPRSRASRTANLRGEAVWPSKSGDWRSEGSLRLLLRALSQPDLPLLPARCNPLNHPRRSLRCSILPESALCEEDRSLRRSFRCLATTTIQILTLSATDAVEQIPPHGCPSYSGG